MERISGLSEIKLSTDVQDFKTIRINSTDLRVVGTNAFTGIYARPVVKLPAAGFAKYKVLMKRGGVPAKAVYTNI